MLDIKCFHTSITTKPTGRFSARVCRFGEPDKGGDVITKGAFADSLKRWRARDRRIPVVFDHQTSDPMLHVGDASPHDSFETADGLVVSGRLYLDEERARKVFDQLQRGALDQWSFTCVIEAARPRQSGGRYLDKLDLVEIGPTVLGKGDTETLMVASLSPDLPVAKTDVLTVDEKLGPYRLRLAMLTARVARARAQGPRHRA